MLSNSYLENLLNSGISIYDIPKNPNLIKAIKVAKIKDYLGYQDLENIPQVEVIPPKPDQIGANLEKIYTELKNHDPDSGTFDIRPAYRMNRINVKNSKMKMVYTPKNDSVKTAVETRVKIYNKYIRKDRYPIAILEQCFYSFPSISYPPGVRNFCFPIMVFMGELKTKVCKDPKLTKREQNAQSVRNMCYVHNILLVVSGKSAYIIDPYGSVKRYHKLLEKMLAKKTLPLWVKKIEYIPIMVNENFESGPGNCTEYTMAIFYMLADILSIFNKYSGIVERVIKFLKEETQCDTAKRMGYFVSILHKDN